MSTAKFLVLVALSAIVPQFERDAFVNASPTSDVSGLANGRHGASQSRLSHSRAVASEARQPMLGQRGFGNLLDPEAPSGMLGFHNHVEHRERRRNFGIFTVTSTEFSSVSTSPLQNPQDLCPLLNPVGESFIPTVRPDGRLIQRRPSEDETKTFTPLTPELLHEHMTRILQIAQEGEEIPNSQSHVKVQIKREEDVSAQLFKTTDPDTTIEILRQGIGISKADDKSIGEYTRKITADLEANIKALKLTDGNTNTHDPDVAKLLAIQRDFFALFFVFAMSQQMEFEGKPQYLEDFRTTIDGLQKDLKKKDDCDNAQIQMLISLMQFLIDAKDERKMFKAMTEFLANANAIGNKNGKHGIRRRIFGKISISIFKLFLKFMQRVVAHMGKKAGSSSEESFGSDIFDNL